MMRKTITRTLTRATVTAYTVDMVEGKPVVNGLEPVVAWGKITDKEADKLVKEAHGRAIVGDITYDDLTFEISVEDFVTIAKVVDKGETED